MPGKTTVYDAAQDATSDLRKDMYREFKRNDGVIDQVERRLLAQADRACTYAASTATFVRVGRRWFGGGDVASDRGMMRQVKDADEMLAEAIKEPISGELTGTCVESENQAA